MKNMVVSQFSMSLENREAAYIVGQNVTGKLVLVVANESKSFESKSLLHNILSFRANNLFLFVGILLECTGFTKVNFTQNKNEKHQTTKGAAVFDSKK